MRLVGNGVLGISLARKLLVSFSHDLASYRTSDSHCARLTNFVVKGETKPPGWSWSWSWPWLLDQSNIDIQSICFVPFQFIPSIVSLSVNSRTG